MTSKPRMWGPLGGAVTCMVLTMPPLDLEVDHLGHDQGAKAHPDHTADPGNDEPLVSEELAHVMRVDHVHEGEDDEGEGADDVGRRLRFRTHRTDLQFHLGALTKHVREV